MKLGPSIRNRSSLPWVIGAAALACQLAMPVSAGSQTAAKSTSAAAVKTAPRTAAGAMTFASPQQAASALVAAVEPFDVERLTVLFGPQGKDIVLTGESGQDRERAAEFVAKAREKLIVSVDPTTKRRAFVIVGDEEWPFPVPIVKRGQRWSFDANAGRQEILYRRIGSNELDAIQIARNYVDAQHEYALRKREGYDVNQYAQRIISTPGTQDGLAWRTADGTWHGPIGEEVARAIAQGYTTRAEPYHGYFFKILKGQGPAAPLGQLDFVVNGAMIGGFALVAAPAQYGVTGVKTFLVSHDGVVYEKDLGPRTLAVFQKMERFNPDKTWTPVLED
jgi:hypothetical protein